MAREVEREGVIEAARPLNHSSAPGAAPENRNSPFPAGNLKDFTSESLAIPQDDEGGGGLPKPKKFPPSGLGFRQKGLIPSEKLGGMAVGQLNELHLERMSQSALQANRGRDLARMRTAQTVLQESRLEFARVKTPMTSDSQ